MSTHKSVSIILRKHPPKGQKKEQQHHHEQQQPSQQQLQKQHQNHPQQHSNLKAVSVAPPIATFSCFVAIESLRRHMILGFGYNNQARQVTVETSSSMMDVLQSWKSQMPACISRRHINSFAFVHGETMIYPSSEQVSVILKADSFVHVYDCSANIAVEKSLSNPCQSSRAKTTTPSVKERRRKTNLYFNGNITSKPKPRDGETKQKTIQSSKSGRRITPTTRFQLPMW